MTWGDEHLGRQAALDKPGRRRCLRHRASTTPTDVFPAANDQDAEPGRHDVEPLADVLADLVHRAGAARAGGGDIDRHFDARQVRRQGAAIDLVTRRRRLGPSHRLSVFFLGLDGGDALLDAFERQGQLIGIEPLRAPTEAMALQFADDRAQPAPFVGKAGDFGDVVRRSAISSARNVSGSVGRSAAITRTENHDSPDPLRAIPVLIHYVAG